MDNTKETVQLSECLQDGSWNSKMDALEAMWRTKIADTQDEYLTEILGINRGEVE